MNDIMQYLQAFTPVTVLIRLVAAALMGGIIGLERGRHGRSAGLRTHMLVCIGAAMTSLTSLFLSEELGYTGDVARLSAQVISGIGFLGAGTILIRNSSVITGLTTAAGMWATAAIGVAAGYGFYSGALIATAIGVFSVTVLSRLERGQKSTMNVYIELASIADVQTVVDSLRAQKDALISYDVQPPKSGHSDHVGLLCVLHGKKYFAEMKTIVRENAEVVLLLEDVGL